MRLNHLLRLFNVFLKPPASAYCGFEYRGSYSFVSKYGLSIVFIVLQRIIMKIKTNKLAKHYYLHYAYTHLEPTAEPNFTNFALVV